MSSIGKKLKKIFLRRKVPCLHYLEVHLVDHCNMNCVACTHYSSISPEKFSDIHEFEKQMKVLSKKLRFSKIRLLGGEPLLHRDIADFILITKKYFPKSFVSVCTNGVLLPSMEDSFWQACRDCDVTVDISKYPPIEEKTDLYEDLLKKNKVSFGGFHDGYDRKLFHNQWGDSDKAVAFENCVIRRKNIVVLRGGKIYSCPKTAFIDIYNNYFSQNVPKDKGINIYFSSGYAIKKYLSKPLDTCRFCSYMMRSVDWRVSGKKQEEWNLTQNYAELQKSQQKFLDMNK